MNWQYLSWSLMIFFQLRSLLLLLLLLFLKISLLEMLIAFRNEHLIFSTSVPSSSSFFFLKISLLEMLIAFGNEHLKIGVGL